MLTRSTIVPELARRPLRIAQVAPLFESVPPRLYGGTERIVSYLTEELVRMGHRVTLFASGDSKTSAELVPMCGVATRLDPQQPDELALHVLMMERVFARATQFDVIHLHADSLALPLARRHATPCVLTLHGRLDRPGIDALLREFAELPLVSISQAQRAPLAWANWASTVHHGLPVEVYRFVERPRGYLAFLGRISPEKGVDQAIEIARRVRMPLRIAAKIDRGDLDYFKARIEPLFADPLVEFIGEIGEADKNEFLGRATALLFPIDWPEPFGMVMIEAMACGTPVIAYRRGSVPEVVDDGVTGFVVEDVESAARAVERVG
ncbi:MAG TPA: glycosyltransferase family 4 protein, partial [Steroidobacteraceae bacterium]|nr:glycosyltransferase family 4 protein [Steroidobacteraceae bacterium]